MACYRNCDGIGFNWNLYETLSMLNLASSSPRGSVEQRKAIANKCEKSHWKSSKYVKTDLNSQSVVRNTLEIGL